MFFRLTNSPATFQMMMNDIFKEEINKGGLSIYLDDLMIYSSSLKEHHEKIK
jgi:hypothetical protein